MTEIDEVASAIQAKHPGLWPLSPDGACGVITTTGRALFIELAMSRPFTSADLDAFKCKQQRTTTEPQ